MFVIRKDQAIGAKFPRRFAVDDERGATVEAIASSTSIDIGVYLLTVDGRQIPFEVSSNERADSETGAPYILHDIVQFGSGFLHIFAPHVKPDSLRGGEDRKSIALVAAEGLVALRSYREPGRPAAWPQVVKLDDKIYDWPEYWHGHLGGSDVQHLARLVPRLADEAE